MLTLLDWKREILTAASPIYHPYKTMNSGGDAMLAMFGQPSAETAAQLKSEEV